ncbi:Uncharacterised protein [Yersinia frederiksenii]|nr:Uncharacterised protein [Yersinia frederiksenii]
MSRAIESLITALKAAAQEEIMFRESSDTSDQWQDEATPENVLLLIAEVERTGLVVAAAQKDADLYGVGFIVFRPNESPKKADPRKVSLTFTDSGLGHKVLI